jgi:hypothetical protein
MLGRIQAGLVKGVLWAGVERGFYFAGKGDSEGLRILAVFAPFVDVYYMYSTQYITLHPLPPPPSIPRNTMILHDLLLTTTWIRT